MAQAHQDVEYIPLMGSGETTNETDDFNKQTHRPKAAGGQHGYSRFLSTFIICAFLVSLLSFFLSGVQFLSTYKGVDVSDVHSLRHPSLYLGLDRVPEIKVQLAAQKAAAAAQNPGGMHNPPPSSSASPVPTYTGRPNQIMRVNSDHPQTNYPQDEWVLLSEKDKILMEFRPTEGSITCTLSSFFPRRLDLEDKMLTLEGHDSSIQIRSLPSSFNLKSTTWGSLPSTNHIIGSLRASYGRNDTTTPFSCSPESPLIVELSCIGRGCRVEYKDADGLPRLGIYLMVD